MSNRKKKPIVKKFFEILGPGLITGASDDDPSGIATYTQAGARFGPQLLWTAIVSYPLMVVIQEMCARIGLVTKHGLTGIIKRYYPKQILYIILLVSAPSIVMNIGANIAAMGAVGNLLVPEIPNFVFSLFCTVLLLSSIIYWSYHTISRVLKWLCITLFSYILIPFLINTEWSLVLKSTLIPEFQFTKDYFMALVGILGTTISPYLFFWQTSMEVEETEEKRLIVNKRLIGEMELDIKWGMFFTNIVFYFIILTAFTVLFKAGLHDITTVEEAAKALKPLAGDQAYLLFALGIFGTGFLSIPVLGGALSYMMAETFNWQEGLNKKFHEAKGFYITMILSLLVGFFIQFTGISPIQALIYTAVLYGITAPILIFIILMICNNSKIMGEYTNKMSSNILGVITLIIMSASSLFLLFFSF